MTNKELTGLSKKRVSVPAYTTIKVDYNDTKPNYYRVQNMGKTPIYCGTSHMPTANNYDFMCNPESMKMYAEPYKRTTLYIFNPSGNDIDITVLSFSAEFDPLTLALSEFSLDLPTADIGLATTISNFETPLPKGDNTIGKVKLDEEIKTILEALKNKDNNSINPDNLADIHLYINEVVNAINDKEFSIDGSSLKIEGVEVNVPEADYSSILAEIAKTYKPKQVQCYGAESEISGYGSISVTAPSSDHKITCIDFLSNDGEYEVNLEFPFVTIPIKPGEVLNNVKLYADSFTITENNGNAGKVRYLMTVEEV